MFANSLLTAPGSHTAEPGLAAASAFLDFSKQGEQPSYSPSVLFY